MSAFPSIKLTYFPAAGRAEALRILFYIGGVPFEDKRVTFEHFTATKESLPLAQLPVLEVDGEVLTQSHAMLRYAGRLGGLYPTSSPFAALKVDEVLHAMGELEEKMGPAFREKDAEKKKALREELATVVIPHYAALIEARLEKMQTLPVFQTPGQVLVHDAVIFAWVKSLRAGYIDHIPTTVLDGFKLINAAHEKVASHPKVQEWYSLPHNPQPKLKLTYFDGPGRAEPIRLAFHLGGIEFEDERLSREDLEKLKSTLPFNRIPVLEVDGEVISQTFGILRYAGSLSGLYPTTDALAAYRIDELFALVDDMFNCPNWSDISREKDPVKQDEIRKGLIDGIVTKSLGFLEKRVAAFQGPYAAGKDFSVADLTIYSVVLLFKADLVGIPTTIADSYPGLQRIYDQVLVHPKVEEYYAGRAEFAP